MVPSITQRNSDLDQRRGENHMEDDKVVEVVMEGDIGVKVHLRSI